MISTFFYWIFNRINLVSKIEFHFGNDFTISFILFVCTATYPKENWNSCCQYYHFLLSELTNWPQHWFRDHHWRCHLFKWKITELLWCKYVIFLTTNMDSFYCRRHRIFEQSIAGLIVCRCTLNFRTRYVHIVIAVVTHQRNNSIIKHWPMPKWIHLFVLNNFNHTLCYIVEHMMIRMFVHYVGLSI